MRVLMCLVLGLSSSMAVAADAPPEGELARCLEIIDALETQTVAVSVEDKPLRDVAEELASRMSVPLHMDWKELAGLDIQPYHRVSLQVGPVACSAALSALTLVCADEFERAVIEVSGGQVHVTSPSTAAGMKLTAVYDVRDLLDMDAAKSAPAADPLPPPAADQNHDNAEPAGPAGPPVTPVDRFVQLLTEHIDPEDWNIYGGNRGNITQQDGLLVISAPAMTHWHVRQFLSQLRAANPSGYSVEAVIVDLPASSYDRLSRRSEPNSLALTQGIRTATEGTLLWQTRGMVGRGKTMELKSSDGPAKVEFQLGPTFSKETGQTSIMLNVRTSSQTGERSLNTQATLVGDTACGVFQMPAAKADAETLRLVVVILRPL